MIELYKWQQEAYEEINNGENGIIVACTGGGKTVLGLKLIEDNPYKKILVVVPTIVLLNQWKEEMIKFGVVDEQNISLIGGGHKDTPTTKVTIAVVNSLRKIDWNHPLAKFDHVVLDECFTGDTKVTIFENRYSCKNKKGMVQRTIKGLVNQKSKAKILTFNIITKQFELKRIIDWFKIPVKRKILDIFLDNGTQVSSTLEQEFFVYDKYKKGSDLKVGDQIIYYGKNNKLFVNEDIVHSKSSLTKVISIKERTNKEFVYDLEVEDNHNFFANGLLVHNCHRVASHKNLSFLQQGTFGQVIGLTATLERADGKDKLLKSIIGPVVYKLTPAAAKAAGYVANYDVESVACRFTDDEFIRYFGVNKKVQEYMKIFNNNYMSAMNIMRGGPRQAQYQPALKLIRMVQERKKIFTDVTSKRDKAIEIVMKYPNKRILLFDELQDSANKIYNTLKDLGVKAVLYHSGLNKKTKEQSIKDFKDGTANVLVSVRALDEGLDVKEADLGIIVNGNSQKRQILQRLGRILRKKEGKIAKLYMLFVPNTQDEKYLRSRLQHLGASDNISLVNPIPTEIKPLPFPEDTEYEI